MRRPGVAVLLFLALFGFWLALSGQLNALFVGMGLASAAVVTLLTHGIVADALGTTRPRGRVAYRLWRALVYLVWLVGRIVVASAQLAVLVLHPRTSIEPSVLRFSTTLEHPVARTILANSITLVPGTMTLQLTGDEYVVHALVPAAADDLVSGRMQAIIGRIFLEDVGVAPDVVWERGAQR